MILAIILSIISITLCISGFFFVRWYIASKTSATKLLEIHRDEVYKLIAEIDAATDRDFQMVEQRVKILRQLLDETDKRIGVYNKELQRSLDSAEIYKKIGKNPRAVPKTLQSNEPIDAPLFSQQQEDDPRAVQAADKQLEFEQQKNEEQIAPQPTAQIRPNDISRRAERGAVMLGQAPSKARIKSQIVEMTLDGFPPLEIATNLGISLAEVELALNLVNMLPNNTSHGR